MTAALSEDQELYVWGGRAEERKRMGGVLRGRKGEGEGEEVVLVEVEGVGRGGLGGAGDGGDGGEGGDDEEEDGILDVGVGESHILILTTKGKIFAVGEGKWGQLGTGKRNFENEWVEVQLPVTDGGTRWDGDGDDEAATRSRPARRHTSEKKSSRDHHLGLTLSDREQRRRRKRKIIGVECGFWNSFLVVSVAVDQ